MKAVRERNKDQERDKRSSRRKKTVLRKKHKGCCREGREERPDLMGALTRRQKLDRTELHEATAELRETTKPVLVGPPRQTPKGVTVRTFQGDESEKAVPVSKPKASQPKRRWVDLGSALNGAAVRTPYGVIPGAPSRSVCA